MSDRMKALAEELQSVRDAALQPVLRLDRLVRTFHQGPRTIAVLNGASADIYPGQAVALVGPSGLSRIGMPRRCKGGLSLRRHD
jgi:lipoprotein-releasing system ATP-binding protein